MKAGLPAIQGRCATLGIHLAFALPVLLRERQLVRRRVVCGVDASDPKVIERAQPTAKRGSVEGWPLRWKVAAIMVLPVLLAATFGALRIQNELSAASRMSIASSNAGIVVPAVELVDRVDRLATAAASGQSVTEPLTQFDASAATLDSLLTSAEFPSTVAAELGTASSTAKVLREEIASGPVPQTRLADQTQSVAGGMALAIATAMASVDDVSVRRLADRLVSVLAAQRALTAQQVLVAAPDFAESVELRSRAAEAAGAEAAAIERLTQLTSTQETSGLVQASNLRRAAYTRPLDAPVFTPQFTGAMRAGADEYRAMAQQLSAELDATVHARATELRSAALRDTAIFLGAVLAALVFALGVGRTLIRSIGRLRRGALEVAQVQLPEEIERLSKGGGLPEISPLPVHTKEEVGQLARAIDDIHFQAVRLASEHGVRLQIGEMFETLSRRSRSLVEEQLALIETLEHDEDDPARLDHLFRLDHLVTRMRRNGDNLLVLADTVERHRRAEPVQLHDVLRAAMSEVEDYHRVTLGATVDGAIIGAAAGDVGHLIAELLDNALRYSPPDSSVLVTASRAVDAWHPDRGGRPRTRHVRRRTAHGERIAFRRRRGDARNSKEDGPFRRRPPWATARGDGPASCHRPVDRPSRRDGERASARRSARAAVRDRRCARRLQRRVCR